MIYSVGTVLCVDGVDVVVRDFDQQALVESIDAGGYTAMVATGYVTTYLVQTVGSNIFWMITDEELTRRQAYVV